MFNIITIFFKYIIYVSTNVFNIILQQWNNSITEKYM